MRNFRKNHIGSAVIWLVVVLIAIFSLPNLTQLVSEKGQTKIPSSSQSQVANMIQKNWGHGQKNTTQVVAVFNNGDHKLTDSQKDQIDDAVQTLEDNKAHFGIKDVLDPSSNKEAKKQLVSKDGTTEIVQLMVAKSHGSYTKIDSQLTKAIKTPGLKTYVTGADILNDDFSKATEAGIQKTEVIAAVFIFIVLIIVFRSPVVPLISLLTVGVTYITSLSIVANLVKYANFPFSNFTQVFMVVVLFGIGTDYNILLYDQFKEELSHGKDNWEATRSAVKIAGRKILYSGLSLLIGFSALFLAQFSIYRSASGVAVGVAVLLIVLLTLNPFFMATLGPTMFWPTKNFNGGSRSKMWQWLSAHSVLHPIISLAIVLIATLPFILTYHNNLNYDNLAELSDSLPAKQGVQVVQKHFSKGTAEPSTLYIQADHKLNNEEALKLIDMVTKTAQAEPGVKTVASATQPGGSKVSALYANNQLSTVTSGMNTANKGLNKIGKGLNSADKKLSGTDMQSGLSQVKQLSDGASTLANGAVALNSGITELDNGSEQISSNLSVLNDGVQQYTAGVGRLNSGASALNNGIQSYTAGASQLGSGASQLSSGVQTYTSGVSSLNNGLQTLANKNSELESGASQLASGVTSLQSGSQQLSNGLSQMQSQLNGSTSAAQLEQLNTGLGQINSAISTLANTQSTLSTSLTSVGDNITSAGASTQKTADDLKQIQAALAANPQLAQSNPALAAAVSDIATNTKNTGDQLNTAGTTLKGISGSSSSLTSDQISQMQTALTGAQSAVTALESVQNALNNQGLVSGSQQLTAGLNQLTAGTNQVTSGLQAYTSGVASAASGASQLSANSSTLNSGAAQLASGTSELNANSSALNSGASQLASGTSELSANSATLNSGSAQLAAASQQMTTGLGTLSSQAPTFVSGLMQVSNGTQTMYTTLSGLTGEMGQLQTGLNSAATGVTKVAKGTKSANSYLKGLQNSSAADEFYIPKSVLKGDTFKQSLNTYMSSDMKATKMTIVLDSDPASETAMNRVTNMQKVIKNNLKGTSLENATVAIGGQTSTLADTKSIASQDFIRTAAIMLVGIALALMVVTRSLLQPFYILGTLLLAYMTSLGLTKLFSTAFLGQSMLTWNTPFFGFIMLIALGVDYSIFLMMKYRELAGTGTPGQRIVQASGIIGAVVLSAALILSGTFAALMPSGVLTLIQVALVVIIGLIILVIILPIVLPALIKLTYPAKPDKNDDTKTTRQERNQD
ncbi:transport protein [Lactobacillus selangorensis]|uniref:Transport protein n=1 Tax=Lactobacillus selangorensis TaxID=81857 RepID=A0A0R2FZ78_9LACO|nr:MMPL family transporter [Lactobacillus selangorensis]KRN29692.1 transport protein [Lactobacillus selangorensis]KRN33779.1 transport protein [Lactobacillus selangorensis]